MTKCTSRIIVLITTTKVVWTESLRFDVHKTTIKHILWKTTAWEIDETKKPQKYISKQNTKSHTDMLTNKPDFHFTGRPVDIYVKNTEANSTYPHITHIFVRDNQNKSVLVIENHN